jgi:tRNA (guanine37-N1)-methyltransferase
MRKKTLTIDVVTLFPEMFKGPLDESIIKIAQGKKLVKIVVHNLRDYTHDRHKSADDKPFGGGPGMVMKPEPIFECVEALKKKGKTKRVIFLSPQGKRFEQKKAHELSRSAGVILLCGHYEGVDQRVLDHLIDEEISIGDFVTSGGETPALCLIDSVVRLVPGVLGNKDSLLSESFQNGLLDYPHYTRPRVFRTHEVPEILFSGNHAAVEKWRTEQALMITKKRRKDLFPPAPRTHKKK